MFQGLLSRLGTARKTQEAYYCQACGNSLAGQGGDVSSSGRIYCHGYKQGTEDRCCDADLFIQLQREGTMGITSINYRNKHQVQSDIKRGKLREYNPPQDLPEIPQLRTIASSR